MAAVNTGVVTADHPVTVKVTFEGVTRRAKFVLRDMVPPTLETKIRAFLNLTVVDEILIERYSDSATTFVELDPTNLAVYKQLYRAAKAKSKLKLRVTKKEHKPAPKPASVENEAETTADVPVQPKRTKISLQELMDQQSAASQPAPPPTAAPTCDLAPFDYSGRPVPAPPKADASKSLSVDSLVNDLANLSTEPAPRSRPGYGFAICCNNCEKSVANAHYHCSSCDDGDFDLCETCVNNGASCYNDHHWLIKRTFVNGEIVNSTFETLPSKARKAEMKEELKQKLANAKSREEELRKAMTAPPPTYTPLAAWDPASRPDARDSKRRCAYTPAPWAAENDPISYQAPPQVPATRSHFPPTRGVSYATPPPANRVMRTCNSCVEERPEKDFLHCKDCEDYDLCQPCFMRGKHGHHPKHSFTTTVPGTVVPEQLSLKMTAGRNQPHNAICDGCDKYITGVRHKCLDCPDWDYCASCVVNASFVHAKHRFVPIYEPLRDRPRLASQPVHVGICCDGPLCAVGKSYPSYIRGVRYKCAICNDVDFCENCEANPVTNHNKTHPLIKFKTPVRNATVSTTGDHGDGQPMPAMGDRQTRSWATETAAPASPSTINKVQTVVDVKPAEPAAAPVAEQTLESKPQPKKEEPELPKTVEPALNETNLKAEFVRDTVMDGSIVAPNKSLVQTWVLKNTGEVAWPAGCAVQFVGGDYMGRVDSQHPAPVGELTSAAKSTSCEAQVLPGSQFGFSVAMRSPPRPGRFISYWRLTAPNGIKFGHRLWCDINVRSVEVPKPVEQPKGIEAKPEPKTVAVEEPKASTMIFPKLEKESPSASMYEEAPTESAAEAKGAETDEFEECTVEDDEWEVSEDGFMTDEEYDILDASDEEFLEEVAKKA